MTFETYKDLTPLTTFGIPARAALYIEYDSPEMLTQISRTPEFIENEVLHIGGGSNLLFVHDFNGLVIHSAIKGINFYRKNDKTVYAIAGAGENWDKFVERCVSEGYGGLENLSGIPGEVGASAVQNIGAYGVEARDRIFHVECFDVINRKTVILTNEECVFGYRDSIFKHSGKGRYYVLRVSFRLTPSQEAEKLDYGPLARFAESLGHAPTISEVRREVLKTRDSRLPAPSLMGSAGSFFKNPFVSRYYFEEEILSRHPDVPFYTAGNKIKLAAGWLIEHTGMKGMECGGAIVYPKQCLVIANKGNATAGDVVRLAEIVKDAVNREFGIRLEPEVNYIDSDIKVTVLGSGTSKGIPEIACGCRVCRSEDSHDKRLRASVLLETHGMKILIDASPDLRQQALTYDITNVDAVLVTHSHYDHVGGFDDLRPFCVNGPVDVYLREDVDSDLHRRLDYCFRDHLYPGVPVYRMNVIDNRPFFIDGLEVIPIEVMHGKLPIFGYRIGNFAYITDCKTIEEDEIEKLRDLDTLIVNALRYKEHFAHMNLEEALALIEKVRPRQAFLTHFNHEIGLNSELQAKLPDNVHPCYDGLTICMSSDMTVDFQSEKEETQS